MINVRFAAVISAAALAISGSAAAFAAAFVGVTVNGSPVDLSPPPIIRDGRVFVPLRGVFEQLGASVDYANGTIDASGNGRAIALQIGSTEATVDGQPQTIDVAPFIVGASTYVPLRFISESLGDGVEWNEAESIAAINTGGGPADYYTPGTASYVDTAPPPIPDYDQPDAPGGDEIWQPGYWAWGSYGYYWVPGTWVTPPQDGYYWTPGYWQWRNVGYAWNPGYWATSVGFYGGVDYGAGYYGRGYDGGRWNHGTFQYNTYVTHVNRTRVHNVYVNRNVYVVRSPVRVAYNGGRGGILAVPTPAQAAIARGHHLGMTPVQQQHVRTAESDRRFLAAINHGRPAVTAIARPLSASHRPAGFVAVKPADRVHALENVAPVRPAARRIVPAAVRANHPAYAPVSRAPAPAFSARSHAQAARPAYAPPARTARPAYVPPAQAARPAYAPPAHRAAPAYAAPSRAYQPQVQRAAVHAAPYVHLRAVQAAPPAYHARPARAAAPAFHPQAAPPAMHAPPARTAPAAGGHAPLDGAHGH